MDLDLEISGNFSHSMGNENCHIHKLPEKSFGLYYRSGAGETVVVIRHGKPVAEIIPVANNNKAVPSWKQPATPLEMKGSDLSTANLNEREAE